MDTETPDEAGSHRGAIPRARRAGPAAMALVIGLAALTAQASESDLVRDIQRYCTVCWRNARLDPTLWDDCTQEVCCRLLTKARAGELDLTLVLAEDTPERRELVRAIDMVRKRVQRAKRYHVRRFTAAGGSRPGSAASRPAGAGRDPRGGPTGRPLAAPGSDPRALDARLARPGDRSRAGMPVNRVSDEKYKALRKLEHHLREPMRGAGNRTRRRSRTSPSAEIA